MMVPSSVSRETSSPLPAASTTVKAPASSSLVSTSTPSLKRSLHLQPKPSPRLLSTPVHKQGAPNSSKANQADFPSTPMNMIRSPCMAKTPCITPLPPSLDEFDIMLCHEDFPKLVSLAARVKHLHLNGTLPIPPPQSSSKSSRDSDPLGASEVIDAVARLQENLMSKSAIDQQQQGLALGAPTVSRGAHPMTDSLIDDSLTTLQQELDRCQLLLAANDPPALPTAGANPKRKKKSEQIAVKYSKWQTDILMRWMIEHIHNPFPDPEDVHELMHQTNLTYAQIINWTTNVRKRNRKATCEDGKKPHHFIDFLFLAQKRDDDKDETKKDVLCSANLSKLRDTLDGQDATTPIRDNTTSTITAPAVLSSRMTTPTGTPSSSHSKKRKSHPSMPPLPAMGSRRGGGTPSPSPTHKYHPYNPHHQDSAYAGTLPFPESPGYQYGHSPYHYPYGPPLSPSGYQQYPPYPHPHHPAGASSPGNHALIFRPRPQGPSSLHSPSQHPYAPYPNPRGYQQRQSPCRPPTPVGSNASLLRTIKEEPEQEASPAEPPKKKSRVANNEGKSSPVVKHESSKPFTKVAIKQEADDVKPETVSSFHPVRSPKVVSFESPTAAAMEPVGMDAPMDHGMLADFASFWEVEIDEHGNSHAGHAVFVLRPDPTGLSPPRLMDEDDATVGQLANDFGVAGVGV